MNQTDSDIEETKQPSTRNTNQIDPNRKPASFLSKRPLDKSENAQNLDEEDLGIPLTENLDQNDMRHKSRIMPALRNSFSSHDGSFVVADSRKGTTRNDSRSAAQRNNSQKRSGNLKELLQRLPSGNPTEDRKNSKSPIMVPGIPKSIPAENVGGSIPIKEDFIKSKPKGFGVSAAQEVKQRRISVPTKQTNSRVDNNSLKRAIFGFQKAFEHEVDLYYKNYNRYIQENKNKMDVYVKATKKERQNYQQFLTQEETAFWKDFPRQKKFYSQHLASIKEIFDVSSDGHQRKAVQTANEVRDIDEVLKQVLDYLPFASRKYCQQFNIEHCPYISDEAIADTVTFDSLTQSLRMFDTENVRNWQILGFVVSILAADVIAVLLEKRTSLSGTLPPIYISSEMTEMMIKYCRIFAQNNMATRQPSEEDSDDYNIVDLLFDQVQFIWANQIYPKLSLLSTHHFDACLKMLQLPLQIQLKKSTEAEVQAATQEIFFCRYLVIVPTDIKTGDKILNLLEKFLHVLTTKTGHDSEEVYKHGVLATLKYLMENLCFFDVQRYLKSQAYVIPGKGLVFEPQAMQMLENRVSKIYFAAEQLSKKESLREYAHYLMATILKVETDDFVEQNLSKFLTQIKFNQFFQNKKTYHTELKLVNQMYYSGAVQLQKYKAWKPKMFQKSILIVDDKQQNVLLPVVINVAAPEHIALGRRYLMPTLLQNQLPTGLSQPNEQPRFIIQSVAELFRLVFNPNLIHLNNDGCFIDYSHWQFLEQACYDDFEFVSQQGIELLLEQRFSEKHTQMVNLALKLAHFVLDPFSSFKERYLKMHGGATSYVGSRFEHQLKTLKKIVCVTITEILSTQLKNSENVQLDRKDTLQIAAPVNRGFRRSLDFFKMNELKTLCNDQQNVVWSRINTQNCFIKPAAISKELKKQKQAKFHLQEQQRLISFEDLNEIEKQDFKYSDAFLNQLSSELAASIGQQTDEELPQTVRSRAWDKKKEEFIRHRLLCYISEIDSLQANSSPTTSFVNANTGSKKDAPIQRQNTTHYGKINPKMHEALKQLKLILKMVHYLPYVQEFFRAYPMRSLVKEQHHFLSERVVLNAKEKDKKEQQEAQTKLDSGANKSDNSKHKLSEVEQLLPYLVLCLDFKIAERAAKSLTKLMLFSKLPMRIALVDQMAYFIKELMLESSDDFQLVQFTQILLNMIRVWRQSEMTKVQSKSDVVSGSRLLDIAVVDLDDLEDRGKTGSFHEIHQHLHVFDYLDMIGLIALSNRSVQLRSIGCLLLVETGKLKRLIVHKNKHKHSVTDICYFQKEALHEAITQKLSLFYGITIEGCNGNSLSSLKQLLNQSFFFQLMVDNFEYSRLGFWESLVRDVQVLFLGDLTRLWKNNMLTNSKYGGVILDFIQLLSNRTLMLFENKQDSNPTFGQQFDQHQKDSVGFNLLLAAVLSNMSRSHSSQMIQSLSDEEGPSSGQQQSAHLDELKMMLSLLETGFGQVHKVALGSFYPSRISTSSVLLSFLYFLQTPSVDQMSLEQLKQVFNVKRIQSQRQALQESEGRTLDLRGQEQYAQNCIIFYCLLVLNANEHFLSYIYDQIANQANQDKLLVSSHLKELAQILVSLLDTVSFDNDAEGKKKTSIKICLAHALCIAIKRQRDFCESINQLGSFDSSVYLPADYQVQLLRETRAQYNSISKSQDMEWLAPKIKQIWFCLLTFETIFVEQCKGSVQLDLKFLIQLEQDGFTDALKYFKRFNSPDQTSKSSSVNEQARANEIKLLIQHVYSFYASTPIQPMSQTQQIQSNAALVRKNLPDSLYLLASRDNDTRDEASLSLNQYLQQNQSQSKQSDVLKLHQKNIYFKCFINQVVDVDQMMKALKGLQVGPKLDFDAVYLPVVNSVFRHSKLSLPQKIKKFTQANMHGKFFLMSLLISLNTIDKDFIEKSKILSLSLLPLMFSDSAVGGSDENEEKMNYRRIVEEKIAQNAGNIKQLVNFENKAFYQFIKKTFVDEELFNMQFNFEKYFSISGFLRDILNEIIKLQNGDLGGQNENQSDKDKQTVPPKMMLKVLDIITYFFSGHLDLRRAPHAINAVLEPRQREFANVPQTSKHAESFIFANLIDYKSFEFLSKLYKVSEKLVDHDSEMMVMNMWYKICENRPHNFEILAKFLVHNLSSFIMKLKTSSSSGGSGGGSNGKATDVDQQSQFTGFQIKSSSGTNTDSIQSQQDIAYGIEYEKQKRYSLSIFNYIKARTMQVDLRNSLNMTGISWSQRMIKLVIHAQLNLQSKYALEKMKLKKVLEVLHTEINHSEIRCLINDREQVIDEQLKQILMVGSDGDKAAISDASKQSVTMDKLLQSQTFLSTFGVKHQQDSSTIKQLLFILSRQMSEHFHDCTPDSQILQLPDLIVKYFENSLILIANEAERLQVIKFTQKEELMITMLVLVLIADLASQNANNDVNRCYFIFDLLNKLAMSVGGIQKYLKLQQMSIEQFTSLSSEKDMLQIFNYRNVHEVFGLFNKIFFRVLHNVVSMSTVHNFLIKFWMLVLERVQNLSLKNVQTTKSAKPRRLTNNSDIEQEKPLYSRKQTIEMIQDCFHTIQFVSMRTTKGDTASPVASLKLLKNTMHNFIRLVKCLFEYIQPVSTKQFSVRDMTEAFLFDPDLAFPINTTFWIAYLCLEAAAIVQSKSSLDNMLLDEQEDDKSFKLQLMKLQELAVSAMRKIFEDSEFFKMLMNLQEISPEFFLFSISIKQRKTALLSLIFIALENPKCASDAYQLLIMSIRIQDHSLLSAGDLHKQLAKDELHRLLLLLPFFNQQFLGEPQLNEGCVRQSSSMFQSSRAMIQLLKKSMLSIAIDKKKDVENLLDEIQQMHDVSDEKSVNKLFRQLVSATVESCIAMEHSDVAVECIRTFKSLLEFWQEIMQDQSLQLNKYLIVEPHILSAAIEEIEQVLKQHMVENESPSIYCLSKDLFDVGPQSQSFILGEQPIMIKEELRSLYFGLKNIVLLEIQHSNKNQQVNDVKQFFGFQVSVQNRVSLQSQSSSNPDQQRQGSLHENEVISKIKKLNKKQEILTKLASGQNIGSSSITNMPQQQIQPTRVVTPYRTMTSSNMQNQPLISEVLKLAKRNSERAADGTEETKEGRKVQVLEQDQQSIKQTKEQLSRILFDDDTSDDDVRVDKALEPAKIAAKSFADNVLKEDQRVKRDAQFYPQQHHDADNTQEEQQEHSQDGQEIEGLIGTFSKPVIAHSPKSTQPQYTKHAQFAGVKTKENSPFNGKYLKGEIPAPKMGGLVDASQAISSIALQLDDQKRTGKAFVPGFVENINQKTDESFAFTDVNSEKPRQSEYLPEQFNYQVKTGQRASTPWIQSERMRTLEEQHAEAGSLTGRKEKQNPYYQTQVQSESRKKRPQFVDQENMPTPKKSSEVDSLLIEIINDQDRFYLFEEFLSEAKHYDMDNLAFYVKVMEFKKESSQSNCALAAGLIIDNYLSEDADYYIGNKEEDEQAIAKVIQVYECAIMNQLGCPKTLFDDIACKVREELIPYLIEFTKIN